MAVVRKEHYTTEQKATVAKPQKKKKNATGFKPIEFINIIAVLSVVVFLSVQVLTNYATIYATNKKIQDIEVEVADAKRNNKELSAEVDELSKFERIMKKAKSMGLQLDENNVKVIEK